MNQLKYALGFGGMMSFYGIVSLVILVLPPGTFGGRQYQIVVIALILITLPFALIIMFVSSRRAKKKAKKELEEKEASAAAAAEAAPEATAPQKLAAPTGTYGDLTSGTEETVQFLKTSNLGSGGKDAVYSLPWYLVAGSPRSGKSSLVMSSNLNFQTLPSQRQSEQKFIRPTGSVDWRVTSDAVFVDTAGRYQSEGIDAEEWASLLETIKKYRSNRPLDGFLLVVNTETILKSDERDLEELAKVLRARLDETLQRLKVRFPVYIVFSNADAIEGFRDSFSTSKNEDKTLVWGATIPLEKSENAQALFDGEYELLHNSLMKRRLVRLSAPFAPVRQLRIFNFPLHFGSARRKFGTFVNALFRPNPFSENPFLRGFYFTAAPIGKSTGNAPQTVGNSYFTERFFRDVVLRDKDLVKTFLASRQRAPIFGWLMTLLGTLLVLGFLVMSGVSLVNNRLMLQEAEEKGERLLQMVRADSGKNPLDKKDQAVRDELSLTEEMRQLLEKLDNYERTRPPIEMRFGLYSGDKIYKEHLLKMYMNVVEQRFKAPAIKKLESDLRKFADSNPAVNPAKPTEAETKLLAENLDMLKAYLMLSGEPEYKKNAQASHVAETLKKYWLSESKTPAEMRNVAEQQLAFWAKQIDRDDAQFRFPSILLDPKLVADTRSKLQAFPAPYRYLNRKVSEISKQIDDTVGPTTMERLLTDSGADTNFMTSGYKVPSAYTRPGLDLMKEAIANVNEEMRKDDWVMGDAGKNDLTKSAESFQIEDQYYRDYAMHWNMFVSKIDVKKYNNRNEAAAALQAFSSPNSPMKILMREIAKNTNLSAKPDVEDWWPWLKSFFIKPKPGETGGTEPEKAFRPLFNFIGTKEQKENAPVEKYTGEMGRAFKSFNAKAATETGMKNVSDEMAADKDPLDLRGRETAISSLATGFNVSSAGQDLAVLLMEPLTQLKSLLGAGTKDQLAKTWTEQILPASKDIEKGYPFEDGATDADLKNLTAFLAPGEGTLSKFYDEKLSNYFEESNGQYKVKEKSDVQFSDEFIAYLNNAFALRKALFGTNPTPKFEYDFAFKSGKDAMVEITIDGQKTDSLGTGSLKGTFPGTSSDTGVLITLGSTSATTSSSSDPPPSANSSNSSVSTTSKSPSSPASSSTTEIKHPGTWGLFKFVDAGGPQKQAGGEYLLKYSLGGKSVTATIRPSGGDLFDKNIFRQVKAPQNFLK